ncbi:MAG: nucleotidyl transferase AbiEii/AbiGii toxin family protein [Candidatus Melainabacteria bacterium]|nr:nucleotidyl transferase AbiEii/AbiGii toxin family protein [Candidatus Melainabacteria bacterium]
MINLNEIRSLSSEWGLPIETIEKDYVLGWLLSGIARNTIIGTTWVFKGGTCLKKCYMETWRFSEDLDFTVLPNGVAEQKEIQKQINTILEQLQKESGIQFSIEKTKLEERPNQKSIEGSIYFQSLTGRSTPVRIKLDITQDEIVVLEPIKRSIAHTYSDSLPLNSEVLCYTFQELFAEKIRAMGQRTRPRDLYDIANIFWRCHSDLKESEIRNVFSKKCEYKNLPIITLGNIQNSPALTELKTEWKNMLGHQIQELPDVEHYLSVLPELFEWLEGKEKITLLPVFATKEQLDQKWKPPVTISHWEDGTYLERIRFAAANRLCVDLRYQGSSRVIEPYSLRKTKDGNIVLYARKHNTKEDISYRVDRIEGAAVTKTAFVPAYNIELTPAGTLNIPPTKPYYSEDTKRSRHTSTRVRPKYL